jgi:aryl-alcohol dehydrogenase-like predicted oxidoreductase
LSTALLFQAPTVSTFSSAIDDRGARQRSTRLVPVQTEGKIRHYGVSVERVEEALKAIEFSGVKTVQIIYNLFRQRPQDSFLGEALRRDVGVLARLPLSSGLLAGKLTKDSKFAESDNRNYNRYGQAFDRGETFSGIDYELGLELVEALRRWVPAGSSMAQLAMRWILMQQGVSAVIPGAKRPSQVEENAGAADLAPIAPEAMKALTELYESRVKPLVHHKW